jgi:hypothetical protein
MSADNADAIRFAQLEKQYELNPEGFMLIAIFEFGLERALELAGYKANSATGQAAAGDQ